VIYLRNATRKRRLNVTRAERNAQRLLDALGYGGGALSISFVGDGTMRRLNREHRGKDRTTDVLSFPLFPPFAVPKTARGAPEVLLGDVVISVEVAARQAADYAAPLADEIDRLLIHGVAHLIGHDHEEPGERARMVRLEKRLAAAIGLDWPYEGETRGAKP